MSNPTLHFDWATDALDDCESAQRSITISAISLLPPLTKTATPFARLWRAWCAAAQRGVSVTIILPAPTRIHAATLGNARAGVTSHNNGIKTRFVPQPRLLHAKSIIIDEEICWIGSGNMTAAAAHYNHEIYVRFISESIAIRITERLHKIST